MAIVGGAQVQLIPTMAKGALTAALGVGAFAAAAVGLEAQFSKTMNVLQATTGATGKEMASLSDLAMKMGKDTVFSARDAGDAMLELARGGITPAQISAGALAGTLTLAAAGELEMGEAANIAVQSMGQFGLKGKDMAGVAAALAGAANASSASVRDMSIALGQGGLAANAVGFSIQETTAILAGFSNAGLKGSDAGTSLKTMLDRLQPSTASAASAFKQLGIIAADGSNKFVKANGEFKSASQIAEVLKTSTEGLTQAEKKRLITQAFGSDSQRAATVLAKLGAAGLKPLIKATSDTGAAQKLAAANMKGTAGALEQLKGSVETAAIKFGLLIAPAVQAGLRKLTEIVNGVGPAISQMVAAFKGNDFAMAGLAAGVAVLKTFGAGLQAIGGFIANNKAVVATFVGVILGVVVAMKAWAAAQILLNIVMTANPIGIIIVAIAALVAGIVYAYKNSETFRAVLAKIGEVIKATVMPVFTALAAVYRDQIAPALAIVVAKFQEWMPTILMVAGVVLKLYTELYKFYFAVASKVLPIIGQFAAFMIGVLATAIGTVIKALVKIVGFIIRVGVAFVRAVVMIVKFQIGVIRVIVKVVQAIAKLPGQAVNALRSLASKIVGVAVKAWNAFSTAVTRGIAKAIGFIKALPGKAATAMNNLGSKISEVARKAFVSFVNKIQTGIGNAVTTLKGIPGKANAAVGNLSSVLWNAGAELVQGFINGILSKIGELMNQIAKLKGLLPGSPVKYGPLTAWNGSSQKAMRQIGGSMVGNLAGGLSQTSALDSAMNNLTRRVNVPRVRVGELAGSSAGLGSAGGGPLMVVENMHVRDENAVERKIMSGLNKAYTLAASP